MSQVIPHLLIQIVDFLKKSPVALSKQSRDGRINSAFNEDEIFKCLETNFAINRPNMRDWVDFSFEENNIFYPVNIKVSTTKTTDNLNCKLGIYYALTGKIPPFGNGVSWDCYFKSLKENIQQNSKDYYFLIINKDNSSDVFATSLKNLESILPNGNNLPFQAKWNNNRKLINRDFESAKAFLLGTF
ncbi:restriction endonuclease, partial [Helicobacter typhlonius]